VNQTDREVKPADPKRVGTYFPPEVRDLINLGTVAESLRTGRLHSQAEVVAMAMERAGIVQTGAGVVNE
jgi:hypothetical protein